MCVRVCEKESMCVCVRVCVCVYGASSNVANCMEIHTRVLQCVAACCSVLHCVLQCVAVCVAVESCENIHTYSYVIRACVHTYSIVGSSKL